MRYVAAFRAYSWDEGVAETARRFFGCTPTGRQVVLADETRGSLGITEYEVISHTENTLDIGLIKYPDDKSLWFNVDYGVYILRRALPNYDYYLLSEADLAVNLSLEPMMKAMVERQLGVITHEVKPSTPDWAWHENGSKVFSTPWRSLLFFMVLSGDAADLLFRERQRQGYAFTHGSQAEWPFCETFLPTVLKEAGVRFAEVKEFADTTNLWNRPRIALDDERANRPGSLVHSVLEPSKYLRAVINEYSVRDWFFQGTELQRSLKGRKLEDYVGYLQDVLIRNRDHAGLSELMKQMVQEGLPIPANFQGPDLAYCKPALSSSTSQWSRFSDPLQDAAGANGVIFYDDYGFHTREEESPWWMVDLLNVYNIETVSIVNRTGFSERFVNFKLETSWNGIDWVFRYAKIDLSEVSADIDDPYLIQFSTSIPARFIKVTKLYKGILHLRRVSIYGRSP